MLPKRERIKFADFSQDPKASIKRFFNHFDFFIKKGNGGRWKFVINVPVSLDKRASKRNYTRRIIEQVILKEDKKLKGGGKILIRSKIIIDKINREPVETEVRQILKNELG